MKRDILLFKRYKMISGCCPVHDPYPDSTYRNLRSIRARSQGIKKEHRFARRKLKLLTNKQANEALNERTCIN